MPKSALFCLGEAPFFFLRREHRESKITSQRPALAPQVRLVLPCLVCIGTPKKQTRVGEICIYL